MNQSNQICSEIEVGKKSSFDVILTEKDVDAFAQLSGDHNPLHTNEEYAQTSGFKGRVVHGMLLGAYVSRFVGMNIPGERALLMKNSLEFKKPCYIGDNICIEGEVIHISRALQLLEIKIKITSEHDLLAVGTVHVKMRD